MNNNIKNIILSFALLLFATMSANANSIDNMVKNSDIGRSSTIAISVKNADTGRTVYQYNEHKYLNPASIQKVFTMKTAYDKLGADYIYNTRIYSDNNGNLYIKLAGDPSFSKADLKSLVKTVKDKYKKPVNDIVIDASVFDNKQWGIGWMWDDDTNALLPKYSAYAIDENKIDVTVKPGYNGNKPEVKTKSPYQITLVNFTTNGSADKLTLERLPWEFSDLTYIRGTVKSPQTIKLPVDSPQRFFAANVGDMFSNSGVKYSGYIKFAPMPNNVTLIAESKSEPLSNLIANTLKNSNNFYSEMIFKTAGMQASKNNAATETAVKELYKIFNDIKADKPLIVDGCGISRNDLMTADWVTEALNKIYKQKNSEDFIELMPKPVEGTLSDRLLDISLNVRAKTGTASGISSIIGYITAKSGKKYSFAIIIQNYVRPTVQIKQLEDELIKEIYNS